MLGTYVLTKISLCVSTAYSKTEFQTIREQMLIESSLSSSNLACCRKQNTNSFITNFFFVGEGEVGEETLYPLWKYRDKKNRLCPRSPQSCYCLPLSERCIYFHRSLRISQSISRKILDLIFTRTVQSMQINLVEYTSQ